MNRSILVVTHGGVGNELITLAQELLGHVEHLESISVSARDSLDSLSAKIQSWAARIPGGSRGLVLTDLKNSSATVSTLTMAKKYPIDCVCGVNLPVLLKALSPSETTLDAIVAAGRAGIDVVAKPK